jgi:hypothetical protein
MSSFREFLRKGEFNKPVLNFPLTIEGWFDLEEYVSPGNYFLIKPGRLKCRKSQR